MRFLSPGTGSGTVLRAGATVGAVLLFTLPALASLGGDASSVEADRAHMKALTQVNQTDSYDVHQMQNTAGTMVSEYVSPSSGKVFAVSWQGQFPPDMQQVLGAYFQQYSAALQSQERRYGHRPLNIQQPGLVIQTGGHMRAYFGRVYIPAMMPEGVKADAIR